MWEPNEIRVVRWFMRFAGVGILIPGVIYALSWPDTLKAFALAVGDGPAPVAAGLSVAGLLLGGLSFIFARGARIGAVLGVVALALGAVVHWQWSVMMNDRLEMLPEGLSEEDRRIFEDTILFAANAQIPHLLKNLVLAGVCSMVFVLSPKLCGSRVKRAGSE